LDSKGGIIYKRLPGASNAFQSFFIIQLHIAGGFGFISPLGMAMKRERVTNLYAGHVQGVGFRFAVKTLTTGFEVTGIVRNLPDGRVELVAESAKEELEAFLQAVRDSEVGRFIRQEQASWSEAKNEFRGFEITH
jgi:acylphosphatase